MERAARRVASYAAVVLGCLTLAPWMVRSGWVGNVHIHMLHETAAVLLALGVAAIALVRFHSHKSDTFLLLGTAFAGTAFLDGYHALATSAFFAERFQASDLASTSPWSWLASRLFLAVFLWMNAPSGRSSTTRAPTEARLDERTVYLLVATVTLACFAFFTFTPLPSAYFPHLLVRRPAEIVPAIFFLLAIVRHLRRGSWRQEGFEHWMMMALLLGLMGQIAFMPFASRPFDAASEAGHMAKNLSYVCVLTGLLGSMYSLFRRADDSAAELARINAALQAEIDERARAEEERDRFFDMSVEMLCVAGFDGWFKHLNPSWEKVLGWTAAELMSRPFTEFVHPEDRAPTSSERQRLSAGEVTLDFENRYLAKDGTYRWLSWRSVAVEEQELIYAVARDVEEQKRIEQLKNDFVSVVSHELRTPLTSIRGSLGLIAGGVAGELPAKARSLVDIAAKNCERLVRLINDILDVEKIESGQMGFRLAPVDLAALAEQATESNRAYAEGYEVELRIVTAGEAAEEARVWGDADRLLQVITNLISNAVKFSPRGGVVEVAVTRGEGEARVAVTDHGPGVPPEFRQRIFEKFAQADSSSTREKGGTGLGLSISRAIVERHQGRIGFASEPGVATAFFFDLPLFDLPERGAPAAGPESGERPLILICEDDRDVARLLSLMLEREGYRADVAHDAAEARRLLGERSYAALTLDLVLPGLDGVTLIRELRGSEATSRLPIVVVSVRAEEGRTELNGGAVGVIDWLAKPIDEGRLRSAMRQAVRPSGARILHVEDDPDLQRVVAAIVDRDATVEQALNLAIARERLARQRFDLVILDLYLPDGSGLELLPFLGSLDPATPVLIFSAHEVDAAVADRVASVLIKSQTSNRELLEHIRSALNSSSVAN
ncbi:MAG TPA: response regulator [Thermoanaerobaculia bacterium]|jgi:PAS domain S-box-containing protein|nr:response regulator [Thermoanaerobaculia bacterium]